MKAKFIIVSPEWGTLVIAPAMAVCAGWSNQFPYGSPVLFKTRKAANEVARRHWDESMNLMVARHFGVPVHRVATASESGVCGQPIDALMPGSCERPTGHAGPCRAFSLEHGGAAIVSGLLELADGTEIEMDAADLATVDHRGDCRPAHRGLRGAPHRRRGQRGGRARRGDGGLAQRRRDRRVVHSVTRCRAAVAGIAVRHIFRSVWNEVDYRNGRNYNMSMNERDSDHSHPCATCGDKMECPGTYERNHDGWPEAVCSVYHRRDAADPPFLCDGCQRKYQIAELNDLCRTAMGVAGKLHQTSGINALAPAAQSAIREAVEQFEDFNRGNDPHGERDFGEVTHDGERVFWKIDYYDKELEGGSEDPSDPAQTTRVLTIMLASEY